MKDADALECIELVLPLCISISERIKGHGMTKETVRENDEHMDLLLMPIFQIGELVGSPTYNDALQSFYPSDIWSQAYGMRNRIAHGYAKLNPDIIWATATESIPELQKICESLLDNK